MISKEKIFLEFHTQVGLKSTLSFILMPVDELHNLAEMT